MSKKRSTDGSSDDAAGLHVPPAKVAKTSLDNSPNDLTSEMIDKALSVSVIKPVLVSCVAIEYFYIQQLLQNQLPESSESNPASAAMQFRGHNSTSKSKSSDPLYRKPKGNNVPMSSKDEHISSLHPSKTASNKTGGQCYYYNRDSISIHSIATKGEHYPVALSRWY